MNLYDLNSRAFLKFCSAIKVEDTEVNPLSFIDELRTLSTNREKGEIYDSRFARTRVEYSGLVECQVLVERYGQPQVGENLLMQG